MSSSEGGAGVGVFLPNSLADNTSPATKLSLPRLSGDALRWQNDSILSHASESVSVGHVKTTLAYPNAPKHCPGSTKTLSSLNKALVKATSSVIPAALNRSQSIFTNAYIAPSGNDSILKPTHLSHFSIHTSLASLNVCNVSFNHAESSFCKINGNAACNGVGGPSVTCESFSNASCIPPFFMTSFLSCTNNHPSLQPGTNHLFDKDPTAKIGTVSDTLAKGK